MKLENKRIRRMNAMWKNLFRYFGVLLLAGTAGCALMGTPDKVQVTEYDLGTVKAPPASAKLGVEFGAFRNLSGAGAPMLFRGKDGSIVQDDSRRFLLLPEHLVRRRLVELFPAPATEDDIRVSGTLNRFEIDRGDRTARLVVDYEVSWKGKQRTFHHSVATPLDGDTGLDGAKALEKCVIDSGRKLAGELERFRKETVSAEGKRK